MSGLTVDDLLAREEIGDVVKNLARGTDRLDAELMASCYHPDGTDDHNVFRGTGTEFAQWVIDTLPHFEVTMHFIGSPMMNFLPCRLVENGAGLTVRLSDWLALPVPPSREARYRPRVGHELIFGLRPEHIREGRGEVPPGSAALGSKSFTPNGFTANRP